MMTHPFLRIFVPWALRLAGLAALLAAAGCGTAVEPWSLGGQTMGTTWSARLVPAGPLDRARLEARLGARLEAINASMSTYDPDSELSRFNAGPGGEWVPVSAGLAEVVALALEVAERTGGAFDVTAAPLVDAWGFGPVPGRGMPPPAAVLETLRERVGWRRVAVRRSPPALRKDGGGVALDLSAVAKGYAVDQLAALLEAAGITRYLVEVGGELRVAGRRADGAPWRVGIERPLPEAARRVYRVLEFDRPAAIATSGDYRNFFEAEGRRFAHIIDPRTGRPVEHALASVTVIAAECATADAWATALTVLGPREGPASAAAAGLAALFVTRAADGRLVPEATPAFAALGLDRDD